MKLVIDIPDEEYELDKRMADSGMGSPAIRRILDGTPHEEPKTSGWTVITRRPMDAEEREVWEVEMGEIADEDAYIYENLPEDGEEVLVCTQFGRVFIDTFCWDEGCYFEEYGEMDGIVAWRPLPEPYKEVDE